jgi:flagellar FliL protein
MQPAAAAPVEVDGDAPVPPSRGKKKLIVIAAAALVLLAGAGGGAAWFIKHKAAAAEAEAAAVDEDGEEASPHAAQAAQRKRTQSGPPAFMPLDPFIVNLADRDSERYAQIGITLELNDPKYADQMKAYMPAVRNGILMVLAHKSSQELLSRAGKERLALEVMRAAVLPLGVDLDGGEEPQADGAPQGEKTAIEDSPVRNVHFSSFIVQ